MIVWGVTGNNHDASLAVMEWRVQGLTDHYHLNLKWAGMSKDFSNIPVSYTHLTLPTTVRV